MGPSQGHVASVQCLWDTDLWLSDSGACLAQQLSHHPKPQRASTP